MRPRRRPPIWSSECVPGAARCTPCPPRRSPMAIPRLLLAIATESPGTIASHFVLPIHPIEWQRFWCLQVLHSRRKITFSRSQWLALTLLFAALSGNLLAVDGVVLIDQNRALAGGITPGDTPGFPVTTSQEDAYRLTGNLTAPDTNTDGIVITANHVTIDLNGFSIIGASVCGGSPITCSPGGSANGMKWQRKLCHRDERQHSRVWECGNLSRESQRALG